MGQRPNTVTNLVTRAKMVAYYTNYHAATYKHVGNEDTVCLKWYIIYTYFCTPLLMSPHVQPNQKHQDLKKLYILINAEALLGSTQHIHQLPPKGRAAKVSYKKATGCPVLNCKKH